MPPLQAAAITVLVALLAHCGQAWGDEIVFRNQMQEGRTMHVTCDLNTGPERERVRIQPVAYLANITFTFGGYTTFMAPRVCWAYYDGQSTGALSKYTDYSFLRDDLRCERCIIAAMPDAVYSMEVVAHYHNIQTDY